MSYNPIYDLILPLKSSMLSRVIGYQLVTLSELVFTNEEGRACTT